MYESKDFSKAEYKIMKKILFILLNKVTCFFYLHNQVEISL